MRNGMLGIAATLVLVSVGLADEPALSSNSNDNQALHSLIERFESRISELELQVIQLKHKQQSTMLGGKSLESAEASGEKAVACRTQPSAWHGLKITVGSRWMVDPSGVIREHDGRKVGHWGIDITSDGATR